MKLHDIGTHHPFATFFTAFLLVEISLNSGALLQNVLGENEAVLVGQSIAAVAGCICLFVACQDMIRFRKVTRSDFKQILYDLIFAAYIVFIAHAVFVAMFFAAENGIPLLNEHANDHAQNIAIDRMNPVSLFEDSALLIIELLGDAVGTAFAEECLFTGIGFLCIHQMMKHRDVSKPELKAALATAGIFAACHIMGVIEATQASPSSGMTETLTFFFIGILKLIQTFLFEICMISLLLRTQSILSSVVVHAGFDFFYFLIPCIISKNLPEIFIESGGLSPEVELCTLISTSVLLIPATWRALRRISSETGLGL